MACVELIAGKGGHVNYDTVPGIVYTHPEVASVGLTEEAAKEKGLKFKVRPCMAACLPSNKAASLSPCKEAVRKRAHTKSPHPCWTSSLAKGEGHHKNCSPVFIPKSR